MSDKGPRAELIEKALKDPAFRAELLKDPAAAIVKATGVKLPAGVAVKVLEDSASIVHLVLPRSASLDEKELQKVAGGGPSGFYTLKGYCDSTQSPRC